MNNKPNATVSATARLFAVEPKTKAKLNVGVILYDSVADADFILLDKTVNFSDFADPRFSDSRYVKLKIYNCDEHGYNIYA